MNNIINNAIRALQSVLYFKAVTSLHGIRMYVPYFSIDNAHLMYNAHPKFFDIPFDV